MNKEEIFKTAEIHPELKAWLDANGPPPRSYDLQAVREEIDFVEKKMIDSYPGIADGVLIKNTTIKARDGYDIPVKTYQPEKPLSGASPLIVAIHGGGWAIGSSKVEEVHCCQYVKKLDAACVNVDYRLAPEWKYPQAVNDCWDVIQYLSKNASSLLPADPNKGFIVTGASAGGSLTDVMAHLSRDNNLSPPVTGVLEVAAWVCDYDYIPDEYKHLHASWEQNADPPVGLNQESTRWFISHYEPHRTSTLFSSLLDPKKHVGMPPVFMQAHGMDPIRDQLVIYHEALKKAGVKSKLKIYSGLPHIFNVIWPDFEATKEHLQDTLDGMAWLLSGAK